MNAPVFRIGKKRMCRYTAKVFNTISDKHDESKVKSWNTACVLAAKRASTLS
jgi:hypothetical protein